MVSVRLARVAMRVRFELALWGNDAQHLQAAGEEALDEIERVESELSPYEPTSDLFAANARAASQPVRVLATTFAFLERAKELSVLTDGAFDLTVGPLLDAWGIWSSEGRVPTPDEISAALDCVGMERRVILEGASGTVRYASVGVRLHPGAIGKGWALDRAAGLLRGQEVARALLHGGSSSVLAIGGPFDISVAGSGARHCGTVVLHNSALGVSAIHGKVLHSDGRQIGHVVDPRTGHPVDGVRLAAVHAMDATTADALSTALLVAPDSGTRLPADVLSACYEPETGVPVWMR